MVGMVMVDVDDVRAAAKRISGRHVRTPLLPWPLAGSEVWLKPENLQPTGAFKLRGASNAIGALSEAARAPGVVTYSSGNHGRAVAWAARQHGVPSVVVMPDTTPAVKVQGVRALDAEVVLVPAAERESRAEAILAEGFAAGTRSSWPHERTGRTIADGLRSPWVGELTWQHIERFVDDVVTVSESAILETTARLAVSARIV